MKSGKRSIKAPDRAGRGQGQKYICRPVATSIEDVCKLSDGREQREKSIGEDGSEIGLGQSMTYNAASPSSRHLTLPQPSLSFCFCLTNQWIQLIHVINTQNSNKPACC
jgi:hypothetical protein